MVEGEYLKAVLPNGIRIVTERMLHVRSVAVGIWVQTGSRYEPDSRAGISHFIEHLVFKGTESRTAEEIAKTVDSVGGQIDAFTSKEQTCFYINVLDEHLPLAADILTDLLLHSRFSPDDVEREKSVILQEIRMVEDTPDDLIHDLFAERVWRGHPLGRPILGNRQVIQSLERSVVMDHFRAEYRPSQILVACAGNVEHHQVVELFGRLFARFSGSPVSHDGGPAQLASPLEIISKPLEQVHLCLGLPGLSQSAPERYALHLLNDVLGGSMSSRLFQEVRERQGLVYNIYSASVSFSDTGLVSIYAGTGKENFRRVLELTVGELRRLKADGLGAGELKRAKEHLKGNLMLSLESTSSRMNRLAKQELYFGQVFSLDEMLSSIEAVGEADIRTLIERVLDDRQMSLVALGPVDPGSISRAELSLT